MVIPDDVTINCEDITSSAFTGVATATDACSTFEITESDVSTQVNDVNDPGYYNYTITRTWTATDECNNSVSHDQIITVHDVTPPVVDCMDLTVTLDDGGNGSIVIGDIDNGSYDNCSPVTLSLSQTSFSCDDIGGDMDELIISEYVDGSGNNDWIEIFNGTGNTVVLGDGVNTYYSIKIYPNGSSSPVIIPLLGEINDRDVYTIAHTDANNITGNPDYNLGSPLMVFDGNDAIALSHEGVNVDVVGVIGNNPGSGSGWTSGSNSTYGKTLVRKPDVNQGNVNTFLPTGLANEWTQYPQNTVAYLGYHDIEITNQANNVILTVTDVSGNVSTCEGNVTVVDDTDPIALCQNVTVQLDADGNGSTTAEAVDNGSHDACGIAGLALSQTDFDCSNIGANQVTLTVTDNNGNTATCNATVIVEDNVAPEALCQSIVVQLDASGEATIAPEDVDNGSNDACDIANLSLDVTNFTCGDVGDNTVTLTVTDNNGNQSTCTATVTVQDNVAPTAVCNNITVTLDGTGNYVLDSDDIDDIGAGSSDACGIASMTVSPNSFTCGEIGDNDVTLTVTDVNGNSSSCSNATVTVEGIIPDVTIVESPLPEFCQGAVVVLTAVNDDDGASYLWDNTGEMSQSIEVPGNGTYGVTVTSSTGCTDHFEYTVTGFDETNLISAYTILATNQVFLHNSNLVQTGGVGVTASGGTIKLHQASTISGFAKAPNIDLKQGSVINGNKYYAPASVTIPPFQFNTQSNAGSPNATVSGNQTLTGSVYNIVEIQQGATVTFSESNIYINQLITGDNATIEFSGCANVMINEPFVLQKYGVINTAGNNVVFYVNDNITIEKGSNVRARMYCNGDEFLVKGENGNKKNDPEPTYMTGLFIGNFVHGSINVIWNADDVCDPCPVEAPGSVSAPGSTKGNASVEDFAVKSWPNPSDTAFNLKVRTLDRVNTIQVSVYDTSGKLVHRKTIKPDQEYSFGKELEGGLYMVKVSQAGKVRTLRLVKY